MSLRVTDIIEAEAPETRDLAIARWCAGRSTAELLRACGKLELYRRRQTNLYCRVRPCSFSRRSIAIICRRGPISRAPAACPTPDSAGCSSGASKRRSPGFCAPRRRRAPTKPSPAPSPPLPRARLPNPRRSGAAHRPGHAGQRVDIPPRPSAGPAAARATRLLRAGGGTTPHPVLRERTPVRMDLTHCGWSDIFFLGMDFPRVPGCSMFPSTWACMAGTPGRARRSKRISASSTNRSSVWRASISKHRPRCGNSKRCLTSAATISAC